MRKFVTCLLLALVLLAGNSCRRRPLYDDCGGKLHIVIELEVEEEMFEHLEPPKIFAVAFYHPESHVLVRTEYVPAGGGEVEVEPGIYDILVYNFDTEYVQLRNHYDLYELEAFTSAVGGDVTSRFAQMSKALEQYSTTSSVSRSYEGTNIIYEPDHLFSDLVENFEVPISTGMDDVLTVIVHPSTIVEKFSITIGPVTNGEYIKSAEVFLTGMASGKKVTQRKVSSGPATIWFNIGLNGEFNKFFTYFRSFGRFPGTVNKVYLMVHLIDSSGNEYDGEWDVTDQIENGGHDIVIEKPITIKPTPGGGTIPTVNPWEDEVTNIVL